MKKRLKNFLLMLFLIGIWGYVIGSSYIISHETIHGKIYERYNISSNISIHAKSLTGEVWASRGEFFGKCNDYCRLSHAMNDVIGYNTKILIFNTWALLMVYLAYRRLYIDKDE